MPICAGCKQECDTPFISINTGFKICHNCRMDEAYGRNAWDASRTKPKDPLDAAIERLRREPLDELLRRRREAYKKTGGG